MQLLLLLLLLPSDALYLPVLTDVCRSEMVVRVVTGRPSQSFFSVHESFFQQKRVMYEERFG